ncbi:tyrosine-type recombinase/integrase [Pseudorhodoferax soli]|uniref:Site-specific recombinase XerD n=1 Tax=Pseudorhodoferax soli TaxID=545864 RepID=A0A368XE69_9BURK|nr:site-specific integrase [Pseudorhodoferax soli]RCW66271.1 site-specific recombinase XerD [Pseudorhodoferax soli]
MADLFETSLPPSGLLAEFDWAFNSWLTSKQTAGDKVTAASLDLYRKMWQTFCRWCVGQEPPIRLPAVTREDVRQFATKPSLHDASEALSPRYVWRLLDLVEKVLAHLARSESRPYESVAEQVLQDQERWRYANAADKDPLPQYLSAGDAALLVTYLSAARPRQARPAVQTWQELRNRTAVALMLGAGLTPGEVRAAQVGDVVVAGGRTKDVPWKVRVAPGRAGGARETPIAPWAGQLLQYWLQVRIHEGIPGQHLLPSTRTGKPWKSHVAQYDAIKLVMRGSGLDPSLEKGGSFRLRHTFALRQLRRGQADAVVAAWLGVEVAEIARYHRVVFSAAWDVV